MWFNINWTIHIMFIGVQQEVIAVKNKNLLILFTTAKKNDLIMSYSSYYVRRCITITVI